MNFQKLSINNLRILISAPFRSRNHVIESHADWLLISAPKRSQNDKTRESDRRGVYVVKNPSVILLFLYMSCPKLEVAQS